MKICLYILVSIFVWSTGSIDGFMQVRGEYRLMFYNAENLFDTKDNPSTEDNDFTPTGKQHWTKAKYQLKLQHIYQAIAAVGLWKPPDIIGLCEVENMDVLNDLLLETPLLKYHYHIVHYDSPDPRGIDVALLYTGNVSLICKQVLPVWLGSFSDHYTRDILYVKLLVAGMDTLHLFVNHWPSRRSGEMETENLRSCAAKVLKDKIENIWKEKPQSKLIIVGDFNDEPNNPSIAQLMRANDTTDHIAQLCNLSSVLANESKKGTLKYNGQWFTFDQIIVSASLLNGQKGLVTKATNAHILTNDFLFVPDVKNMGVKPFTTFSGPRYNGGYSDHLPVYLDLFWKR
jgi:predicted extracellular nuclease